MHDGRVQYDSNTGAAAHRLIGQSLRRKRLTIYPPISGAATISNEPGVASGQGIYLATGAAPLYLDVDYHGVCVEQEWYIIYTGGGSGCAFIETLCHERGGYHDSPHHAAAP